MGVEIVPLEATELRSSLDDLVEVWSDAFSEPPYSAGDAEVASFSERLPRHAALEGFRCLVAREGSRTVGFAYGYTDRPGQWWHEQVEPALAARGLERWLAGSFVVSEMAVVPGARGRGIGGRLQDALLDGLPHRRAVLSTHQEETAAMRLYRRRGWTTLARDVVFPGSETRYMVMGLNVEDETGELGGLEARGGQG